MTSKSLGACLGALVVASLLGLWACANEPEDASCTCVWYTSEKCECTAGSSCPCAGCEKNGGCQACTNALRKGTGTIKGLLKSPYARLAEGVVFVKEMPGRAFRLPSKNPIIDQKNLVYVPHVLPVLIGSTVDFPNSDSVRHNVYSTKSSPTVFNLGQYPAGEVKHVTFDNLGLVSLLCNVHAEMNAYVVVCETPYFAVTEKKDGSFLIRNVPAGTWTLSFWHEKLETKELNVTVEEGKEAPVEFKDLAKRK